MRIALSGKFASGKDSIATELGFPRYAFADGMKDEVVGILALKGVSITRDEINRNKAEYRSMLQVYGTDFVRRHVDDDYWIDRLLRNITTDDAVVTDVRFPNEADALLANHFLLIRLDVRPDSQIERYTRLYGHPPAREQFAHSSEMALDDYPFQHVVDANQPFDLVLVDVCKIMGALMSQWINV